MSQPQLPEGYTIRRMEAADYDKGVLDTLATLTTVGEISKNDFIEQINYWNQNKAIYNPTVIIIEETQEIVGTGMVFIEKKLIHNCGKIGHIEDISIKKSQQGKKLGLFLINYLTDIAQKNNCYKVILDCSQENIKFYEKCGYNKDCFSMAYRFKL
ncbi:glucosamine 6-phosphate N-acetyltransferase [Ascoidea rubescens DSM 1968]|uniref:Glucosamine 6-phosphate N-acetyltransferase n=1 Tax=Ascoidea rubescens DSM 1968 TaxID=1344418 RepID=A0A1D2VAF3_9ASCO|nr:acyl-CoA N-acyltransferase [Ascoidea rubescens DSM 1968]ODV58666.1 acyl-CoA N-acyltransferase [Ascoidea rubescens DSM 1968]